MNKLILNIPGNLNLKAFYLSVFVISKMYKDTLLFAGQAVEM